MARLLFCCINGNGLGHVTRILALARQIKKRSPEADLLVMTTSDFTHILAREGIASVKLPTLQTPTASGGLNIAHMTQALCAQVVATYQPDAVIVDSSPGGLLGEYMSFLNVIPKKFFIFGMFPNFMKDPRFGFCLQLYTHTFMPFEETEKTRLGVSLKTPHSWVGHFNVREREELLDRDTARKRIGLDEEDQAIFVNLGGGGNPQNDRLLQWVLSGLETCEDYRIVCPLQPLAKDYQRLFDHPRLLTVQHFPIVEYYRAFDFAISAAGMNAIAEMTHAGLPALWVPLGHPSTDQDFNAQHFSEMGFGIRVTPYEDDSLKQALDQMTTPDRLRAMAEKMNLWQGGFGAQKTAEKILSLL